MKWTWLSLRAEREFHLQHYGKIGLGDLDLLERVIEEHKVEEAAAAANAKAKEKEKEDAPVAGTHGDGAKVEEAIAAATLTDAIGSEESPVATTRESAEGQQQEQPQPVAPAPASQGVKMEE
jgi:hypothetical protein